MSKTPDVWRGKRMLFICAHLAFDETYPQRLLIAAFKRTATKLVSDQRRIVQQHAGHCILPLNLYPLEMQHVNLVNSQQYLLLPFSKVVES